MPAYARSGILALTALTAAVSAPSDQAPPARPPAASARGRPAHHLRARCRLPRFLAVSRLLVTGAGGLIGRQIVVPPGWELVRGDVDLLRDGAAQELVARVRPSHLLHLAWETEHGRFWHAPENVEWVAASLRLLRVGPPRVTFAVFAAAYRAPLGGADFSLFLRGPTQAGQSELVGGTGGVSGGGRERSGTLQQLLRDIVLFLRLIGGSGLLEKCGIVQRGFIHGGRHAFHGSERLRIGSTGVVSDGQALPRADIVGIDRQNLHLVGRNPVLPQDDVQDFDVGVGARDDADAAASELLDLFNLRRRYLLAVLWRPRARRAW